MQDRRPLAQTHSITEWQRPYPKRTSVARYSQGARNPGLLSRHRRLGTDRPGIYASLFIPTCVVATSTRRLDRDGVTPTKSILRPDGERGVVSLDDQTTLAGVPAKAWEYRLGNRSALEWVLDQYKEKKVKDPTIRERFNTYRFADHKERVIDLLGRVCAVSVFTTNIVNELGTRSSIELD